MIAEIYQKTVASAYQPSKDVADLTALVQKDYSYGYEILNRSWTELNDRSIIDDENRGQLMFNAFVDTSVEDAGEAWKWRGTRSRARNKGIAMHANLTSNYLLPLFLAQNDADETDRDFSEIMRDLVEWMALPNNSDYQSSFMQVVFGMLTNPVTYMSAEFCEVYQTIKERQEDGSMTTKEVLDEVLSGFQVPIWSSSQILITNAYERNIQKQRTLISRRWVDKTELEGKWKNHENWPSVQAGMRSVFNVNDGLFYDIKDNEHPNLVEECIWKCRRDDSEVPFLGGIYMGDANVDNNPIYHRDNHGNPKYNVVPFGYHRIGEHFFYYKSMMNVLGWDNDLYDAMSEITMNRAMLELEMPIAVSGSDKVDTEIIFPNSVVAFEDPNAKVSPLLPPSNMRGAMEALSMTGSAMDDESISPIASGAMPGGQQRAYVVAQTQAAAQKIISGVGKSLGESIAKYGDLMKDIAINHITVPEVEELLGGRMQLKYKKFHLDNKTVAGKMVSKSIQFEPSLIGADMSEDEQRMANLKLLEDSNWPDSKHAIIKVNPELFAKFKYLSRVDVEEMFAKNAEYWKPILTNLYVMLAQDPLVEHEALLRKLMYSYFQSEGDDYIKKNPQPAIPPLPGAPAPAQPGGAPSAPARPDTFGKMAQNQGLSTALGGGAAGMH